MSQLTLKVRIKNAVNLIISHTMIIGNDELMSMYDALEQERIKRIQYLQKDEVKKINKLGVHDGNDL